MLDGLGNFFGSTHEVILHSLENLESSAIKVINGHFSNRKEGAPITDMALKMLSQVESEHDYAVKPYYNKNQKGVILKSSTIPVIGENDRIIGLICINMHLEMPLIDYLQDLLPSGQQNDMSQELKNSEHFSDNIDELITTSLTKVKQAVESDPNVSHLNQNKEIVICLYDQGIFNLKDSVIKIADRLGISKNTIYLHIRNHKKEEA
ncbi:helix-turn-helix transcriptional regulator [Enterococcus faecalis]|uniref:helix-turn-helix transcriptional regulator n=1 Tax=Enterococcus faecalis TaxID=1351 RepID=UPI001FA7AFD5|nr:PAS domain-containing protein [Enterococcus faecalis]WGL02959.1 PAS domain-containing protein [Enterococcus faecalis]